MDYCKIAIIDNRIWKINQWLGVDMTLLRGTEATHPALRLLFSVKTSILSTKNRIMLEQS